jgi:hypothetical protein
MNNKPHPHEDPTRTTPIGLARYAAEFLEAALAADDKMGRKPGFEVVAPVPVMFLVGHSIELSLKSFLLFKGESLRRLRTHYGHDLHSALRKAKEYGLLQEVPLSDDDMNIIEVLDNLYSTKQLQYIVSGATTFPVFGPLESTATKLSEGVSRVVGHNPRRAPNAE